MGVILAVLILALLFGGLGFVVKALWIVAIVIFVLWLLGFLVRLPAGAGKGRWYRW